MIAILALVLLTLYLIYADKPKQIPVRQLTPEQIKARQKELERINKQLDDF